MASRNFFAELKRRNVYATEMYRAQFFSHLKRRGVAFKGILSTPEP